ncbi:MAG: glycosyltransferase family 2 protein [Nitrospiraceae bacterium]
MTPLVSIGIPVYKRLDCLHLALQSVAAQDYPHIELIVSDNGQNGTKVREIADKWYPRPYVFRQNEATVNLPAHHSQLVQAASGRYFAWLPDDDTISSTYISDLVSVFEQHPEVSVALARQELVDTSGRVLRRSPEHLSDFITGEEFIRNWMANGFDSYTSIVARTQTIRDCGGYLDCPWGNHSDNGLMVKLCLTGSVAYRKTCAYRLRHDDTSFGWSLSIGRFAEDTARFVTFLESDPLILSYASRLPEQWKEFKRVLLTMTWQAYYHRWETMGRQNPPLFQWMKAALAVPYLPAYYLAVGSTLRRSVKERLLRGAKRWVSRSIKGTSALI